MNIILGTKEIPIITAIGKTDTINGIKREIIEFWTEQPLSPEDIEYIQTHDSFTNDVGGTYTDYKEVVRYSTWLAQTDPNAAILQQMADEKQVLVAEKEAIIKANQTMQSVAIPTLLRGRNDDVLVVMAAYIPQWEEGIFVVGDVRKDESGYPKICVQSHNSLANPNYDISVASLWSPYHAKSADHALPWITPTGAHDMYKANEYMVFTNGKTYKCVSDTVYSPSDYAQAWQLVSKDN